MNLYFLWTKQKCKPSEEYDSLHSVAKCVRAAAAATIRGRAIFVRNSSVRHSIPQLRTIHGEISVPNANQGCYSNGQPRTAKTIKGLAKLVKGNIESGREKSTSSSPNLCFEDLRTMRCAKVHTSVPVNPEVALVRAGHNYSVTSFILGYLTRNVALYYGEFLHATGHFEMAKEMYQKAIEGVADTDESLCFCNMNLKAVSLAATLALRQLESHIGYALSLCTRVLASLNSTVSGHNHPNVGVILTKIVLMYRNKAKQEHSSSIMIQEGLFRRALELMKAPPLGDCCPFQTGDR